jgi:hypothetical protein
MKKEGTSNKKLGDKMRHIAQKKSEKAFTFSLLIQNSIFVITVA